MTHVGGHQPDGIEIHVSESDTTGLTVLGKADMVFAVVYSVLFLWGLVLTVLSI